MREQEVGIVDVLLGMEKKWEKEVVFGSGWIVEMYWKLVLALSAQIIHKLTEVLSR